MTAYLSARRFPKIHFILFLIFLVTSSGMAQKKKILKLNDAIDIALEKSFDMKTLRLQTVQATEGLIAAKGRFKTNAQLYMSTPSWEESVSQIQIQDALPVYNTTGEFMYRGILDINQPLPTDGTFTLRSRVYHRDVSTFREDLGSDIERKEMYTSLSLNFTQPLFTMNTLKTGLKRANLQYERTSRYYKRSELNNVYDVTRWFFIVYRATRNVEIQKDDVEQQQALFELASKKYNAGLIPEVGALQFEVDLAESKNELVKAEGELARAEDSFKQLIGLDLEEQVGVQTDVKFTPIYVDLDRAIELALTNRSEIRENEIDVELAKISVKQADARSEIKGELVASYDLTGISDPTLPYGSSVRRLWDSSLDDLDRRPNNRSIVFNLSVPLWDWGVNAAEVAEARAELQSRELDLIEQKKTIIREVRAVVGELKEAENRLHVLEKQEKVAQKAFDISVERFNNGDITSQDLALDRNRLVTARSSYLEAFIDFKIALADLKRKTMWDFENNKSLVN